MTTPSKFRAVLDRLLKSDAMSWEDFLEHFDLQNTSAPEGPAVGRPLADFALPDQSGAARTFADLVGPSGLLLVFVRSVHWCGYCRNQLGELNLSVDALKRAGVHLAAVAPDAPDLVAEFAAARNIAYPILADHGAHWIEHVGLLNTNVTGSPLHYEGRIPFPAHLLISPDGLVAAKHVAPDLRHRPSAATLVMQSMGPLAGAPQALIERDELKARISLATNRVHGGQEIAFHVEIAIGAGWRLYGGDESGRHQALSLRFDEELLAAQALQLPAPEEKFLEDVGERAAVYEGALMGHGVLRLVWSPPVHGSRRLPGLAEKLKRMHLTPGTYKLRGSLAYQACGHGICTPPQSADFTFPITIEPDLDVTRPYPFGADEDHKKD